MARQFQHFTKSEEGQRGGNFGPVRGWLFQRKDDKGRKERKVQVERLAARITIDHGSLADGGNRG